MPLFFILRSLLGALAYCSGLMYSILVTVFKHTIYKTQFLILWMNEDFLERCRPSLDGWSTLLKPELMLSEDQEKP